MNKTLLHIPPKYRVCALCKYLHDMDSRGCGYCYGSNSIYKSYYISRSKKACDVFVTFLEEKEQINHIHEEDLKQRKLLLIT